MSTNTLLHNLIGQQLSYNNKTCLLIEVMDDGPFLVFQCNADKEIQCNQHGNAHRKSSPTFTIHCLNEFKTDLHPALKQLLPDHLHNNLLQQLIKT